MDKATIETELDELFSKKREMLGRIFDNSALTTAAKKVLEKARVEAMSQPAFAELKNDKAREAFIKVECEKELDQYDGRVVIDQLSAHELDLINLDIDLMRLIIRINCDWQD